MSNVLKFANPIKVGVLTSDPVGAEDGTIYYNSSTAKFRQLSSATWADVGAPDILDSLFRISNATDPTKKVAVDASGIATGTTRTITMPNSNVNLGLVGTALQTSQLGAASGVASLDPTGKVPSSQLPSSVVGALKYKGTYDASVASYPASPAQGDYYVISVAGTISGHAYKVGDWIAYDGTQWDFIDNGQAVTSVNGATGAVVLTTDNVAEGTTNKYFTDTRAQTAAVENSLAASTVMAPSASAVNTALAAKLSSVSQDTAPTLGGDLTLNGKAFLGPQHRSAVATPTNWIEQEYLHAVSLSASATNTVAPELGFAFATFAGIEVTYTIREATTNRIRLGRLRVVTDGTNISVVDDSADTADVGVSWSAVVNGANIDVRYTTTANAKTMRADIKRFKT
jgi:hypothetical protein